MGNKREKVAIYEYTSIGFKTYVVMAGLISFLTSLALQKYLLNSYVEYLQFTLNIMFKQLSFVLAVIASAIAIDTSLIMNLSKQHEDYSIIKMLNENSKKMKIEIFSSVVGINFFIVGAFIEEWINEGIRDNLINIPDHIIGSIFIIGFIFLSIKICLSMIRKRQYKSKLKGNN